MKTILLLLLLFSRGTISAQLTITPGADFHLSGNALLTLRDIDLVNNGSFTTGNSMVSFSGNSTSAISGTQPVQFYETEINKTSGGSVSLQRMIGVTQRILFTSVFLDLDGFDADLGTTAYLDGEAETSRIIGPNGGQVLFSTSLNAPAAANPANMGAIITSSQNLGATIIRRGHQSQTNGSGAGASINRYYDILPANNSALNASLRIQYFDAELNGLNENDLGLVKSPDNINWQHLGYTSRDGGANFLEKAGLSNFYRSTLSTTANALPLVWGAFSMRCETNGVTVQWQTLQEFNTALFIIQRSNDGIQWTDAGKIPAAGNSSVNLNYHFNDAQFAKMYRVVQTDIDGSSSFSAVLQSACTSAGNFKAYPNPVKNMLMVLVDATSSQAFMVIRVFDAKGAQVQRQIEALRKGSNHLQVNMNGLAKGSYWLQLHWSDGRQKTVRLEKQ